MAKRVDGDWKEPAGRDDTGTLVFFSYDCPYCGEPNYGQTFFTPDYYDTLDSGFELDHECEVCGKNVIVVCE